MTDATKTTTRHLVDPDLLEVIDMFPGLELTVENLADVRRGFGTRVAIVESDEVKAAVATTKVSIPGPKESPDVSVVVHQPRKRASSRGAILHIHGGGYVTGDP
jgi:acetyl esterase/lipase